MYVYTKKIKIYMLWTSYYYKFIIITLHQNLILMAEIGFICVGNKQCVLLYLRYLPNLCAENKSNDNNL